MKKLLILFGFLTILSSCGDDDNPASQDDNNTQVVDADGNIYNTVAIGNQIWMTENLKTTKFNDGTPIVEFDFTVHNNNWNPDSRTLPLYKWASIENTSQNIGETLPIDYNGAMYNNAAVETGNLAPEGWRIPTPQDYIELRNYVASQGFTGSEGVALKSTQGWNPMDGNGTDDFDFNAKANGYVRLNGIAQDDGSSCLMATTELTNITTAGRTVASFRGGELVLAENPILLGTGIRCIKITN